MKTQIEKLIDYREWRETANGRAVFEAVEEVVLLLQSDGKRAGCRDLYAYVRVNYWLQRGKEKYKVNNNYSALTARELEEKHPCLAGYFEHREAK